VVESSAAARAEALKQTVVLVQEQVLQKALEESHR
jgi:hypothetical protein